jgi:hypothetical protein
MQTVTIGANHAASCATLLVAPKSAAQPTLTLEEAFQKAWRGWMEIEPTPQQRPQTALKALTVVLNSEPARWAVNPLTIWEFAGSSSSEPRAYYSRQQALERQDLVGVHRRRRPGR